MRLSDPNGTGTVPSPTNTQTGEWAAKAAFALGFQEALNGLAVWIAQTLDQAPPEA